MTQFHPLTIKEIRKETPECVSIVFDIPPDLAGEYSFEAGQNITLKFNMDGEELRRSYSICSSPLENELRVAVKKLSQGKFSGHANQHLKVGDVIEVLPPTGKFSAKPDETKAHHYLAFAAGSGITPVISIIKTTLASEHESSFTLVYGNRNRSSIIFKEQLEGLKNKYMERFILHHVLSRENTDAPVNHGRINAEKCEQLSTSLIDIQGMDHIFICGPEEMIFSTRDWLLNRRIPKEKIHFELFTVPGQAVKSKSQASSTLTGEMSKIRLKLDGVSITYDLQFDGPSILDGALGQGADLPFACKGGVCATCRAKLLKGEVEMENNYALETEELDAGFILTCQSHPRSPEIEIDFDVKG